MPPLTGRLALSSGHPHEHPRSAAVGPARGARRRAAAVARLRGRRAAPGGVLLHRREGRPDAPLHRLGGRDVAAGRGRDRGALPLGSALVARHPARRPRGQHRAVLLGRFDPARQPGRTADRQHGRDRRRRAAPDPAGGAARGAGPRRTGDRHVRRARGRRGDQRHRGHDLDAGGRRGRRRGHADVLAYVVARRSRRRARRRVRRARLEPLARGRVAAAAHR